MFAKTFQEPRAPVKLSKLLKARGVYNVRKAPKVILDALLAQAHCRSESVDFTLHDKNSMQIRTELRKRLASELAAGSHEAAFKELYDLDDRPRADDLE